jgi:taurine dioxygenase
MAHANTNTGYRHIDVAPIAGALGAEVTGADIATELADEVVADIRQALLDHQVIFFRDQSLSEEALMAFGRRFGDLLLHPNLLKAGPHPEVIHIRKEPTDTRVVGEDWHADTTCLDTPPMGGILYALETPPAGGDTLFASQSLAYEALSDGMRAMLDGMNAVHNDTRVAGPNVGVNKGRSSGVRDDDEWRPTESVHPVVRTHPETGRKGLFVNISYTRRFEGMTEAESAPLLQFLYDHASRPEFTCRFNWKPGSVTFWDNRCVNHIAVNDYYGHRRDMRRVQVVGDRPY